VKEIERAGIPVAIITALYGIALTIGSPRVITGTRIEHVCGDPRLSGEDSRIFTRRIVRTALRALQTPVDVPTLFKVSDTENEEATSNAS